MSWSKLVSAPNPLFNANGDPYSGAVLKAYLPGTTTSTSIAIDADGSSPQASIAYNSDGILEVSGNEIIPYIDRKCKWGIFANSTDAAANTPFYMGPFDNVFQLLELGGSTDIAKHYATLTIAVAAVADLSIGDVVICAERTTGNGGGATWDVVDATTVTEDEYSIVTGDATRSFVLSYNYIHNTEQYGTSSASLQSAIDDVTSGDSLDIGSNSSLGTISLTDDLSISGKGELTLSGASAGFTLDASLTKLVVDGVKITGDYTTVSAHKGFSAPSSATYTPTDILIQNCNVNRCVQNIELGGTDGVQLIGNIITQAKGTASGQGYGASIGSEATNVIVGLNRFEDCDRHSLYLGNTTNSISIGNSFFEHGKTAGITASSQSAHDISRGKGNLVVGELFVDTESSAITIADDATKTGIAEHVSVQSCMFQNTLGADVRVGVLSPVADSNVEAVTINGNSFYPSPARQNGFIHVFSGKNVTISNNQFNAKHGTAATYNAIVLGASSGFESFTDDIIITGNTGKISTTGGSSQFIAIAAGLCTGTASIEIFNNLVTVDADNPIDYSSTPTNPNIKHDFDYEKSLTATAGAINIAGYNNFVVDAAGPVTVTSLDNGYEGKIVTFRFATTQVVTFSDPLLYLDGGSFASTNRDTFAVQKRGTAWFELSRGVNS